MEYVIVNEEGKRFEVRGKVKEFKNSYEMVKYFDRNKLGERGWKIKCIGIDREKNSEFKKYLK